MLARRWDKAAVTQMRNSSTAEARAECSQVQKLGAATDELEETWH